jgi:hypothetical protein
MTTQIKIITTGNRIYGSYVQTICFSKAYTTEDEKEEVYEQAKACMFGYALSFGTVSLEHLEFPKAEMSDMDIFDLLAKKHNHF